MNMFRPNDAKTVSGYLAAVPEERKETMLALHALIQKTVPKLTPFFATNMIGYGAFPYTNYKKENIEWPIIALANQKQYISLYVCALSDGKYVAEKFQKELGNVSVGRSCIRFKKIDDVNVATLKKVLKEAEKHPGLPR